MDSSLIFLAAFGGIAVQLIALSEAHKLPADQRPDFRDPLYWIAYIIMAGLGVVVAWAYIASGFELKGFLAIHVGASAPLILRTMASLIPQTIKTEVGA
ncbi:hypothetical protein [Comamonas suwonensis]|uniref:Uncharacterized protein n=1 Tax=Comamonas suwonensis TaxID=2606214 RepID=A0A843BBX6_9BURK|nr:hypothetical protein [Comamonas suwonensis]MBI1626772.1 hypothetical protein [Comamonas suwonensis]